MNSKQKKWFIAFGLVIAIIIIRMSGVHHYLSLEIIRANSHYLQSIIENNYIGSVIFFVCLIAGAVALTVPISILLTIASGYFFGAIPGGLYSILGATLGSLISFFTFRYLLRSSVEQKYGHKLNAFNKEIQKRGASYLLFLQLLPITPFAIIIVISSLSQLSWWTFAWTTAVGIAPGSFIYAFAGRQMMHINKVSDILSWPIIIALSLLALFSLVPLILRKIKAITFDADL